MKMNDEPINHLFRVLGRLEMRKEVDLVKTESQRERGWAVKQASWRGFSATEASSPSI